MSVTLTIPNSIVQLSGNEIRCTIETNTNVQGMSAYKCLLKITCLDGAIPGGPWVMECQPTNGVASFDISPYVNFTPTPSFNFEADDFITEHANLAASLRLDAGETYITAQNAIVEDFDEENWEALTVLHGHLEGHQFNTLNQMGETFYSYFIQPGKFLTMLGLPSNRRISVFNITDNVKVWAYRFTAFGQGYTCRVHFSDGTTATASNQLPSFAVSKLYELNIELKALEAAETEIAAGKIPIYYTFSLNGNDLVTVDIANTESENHDVLFIENRFGAIETLNCYGECITTNNSNAETYAQQEDVGNQGVLSASLFTHATEGAQTFKINTGFKPLVERLWIGDLLQYRQKRAWLKSSKLMPLDGENYGIAPVIIKTTSLEVDQTSEDLKSLDLELQIAHR